MFMAFVSTVYIFAIPMISNWSSFSPELSDRDLALTAGILRRHGCVSRYLKPPETNHDQEYRIVEHINTCYLADTDLVS